MPEEEIIKSDELPVEEIHEIKPIDKAKEGKMAEVSPSFDSALSDKKPAISAPVSIKTAHSKKRTPFGMIILVVIILIILALLVLDFFNVVDLKLNKIFKFG